MGPASNRNRRQSKENQGAADAGKMLGKASEFNDRRAESTPSGHKMPPNAFLFMVNDTLTLRSPFFAILTFKLAKCALSHDRIRYFARRDTVGICGRAVEAAMIGRTVRRRETHNARDA